MTAREDGDLAVMMDTLTTPAPFFAGGHSSPDAVLQGRAGFDTI